MTSKITETLDQHLAELDQLRTDLAESQVELDLARSEAENIIREAQRRAGEIVTDAAEEFNTIAEKYRGAIKTAAHLVQPAVLKNLGHTAPKDAKLPRPVAAPVEQAEAA